MIEEAITNLTELQNNKTLAALLSKNLTMGQLRAIQLGIEALERLKVQRSRCKASSCCLLPSEGEK